jgi:glycerophosphoryl diester phosphodiesterase
VSSEVGNLIALRSALRVHLVQLTSATGAPYDLAAAGDPRTYADLTTPAGLRAIARYADVLGPDKNQIVPPDAAGALLAPTTLVGDAHAAGLDVVPYTFRNENTFLPLDFRRGTDPSAYGNAFAEYALFLSLGVDGLFSDNPDTAREARGRHDLDRRRHARPARRGPGRVLASVIRLDEPHVLASCSTCVRPACPVSAGLRL